MEVKLEKVAQKWNPRKLEIIFEDKEEFTVFRGMIRTNISVPRVVYGDGGFEGRSREKEHTLHSVLNKISAKFD